MNLANLDELVGQFQRGDVQALEAIYQAYKDPLYRFVYRYTLHEQFSIDIVQDTFERLQRGRHLYHPEKGSFKTYLFQIAYNMMRTKLKRQQRFYTFLPILKEQLHHKNTLPHEEKMTVQAATQSLSDDLRAVILLTYYHDLSQKEISEILDIPVGTVKSRLARAKKKMKKELEVDGEWT